MWQKQATKNVHHSIKFMSFDHIALKQTSDKKLVYTAMTKHLFYYRMHVSKFVIENDAVPLNPFMIYEYFLLDSVDRDLVRAGNNTIVRKCDEIWVFEPISNGVLAEIKIAKENNKKIKYFRIAKPHAIIPCTKEEVEMEKEVEEFRNEL